MCKKPINIKDTYVKCGHCIECLIQKSQEWAFRVESEAKEHDLGVFLTLTYNDKNAIWIDSGEKTLTTLSKRDFQLFMKRIRKKNRAQIRFFCCGEYGETYGRAHYHALLFGVKKSVLEEVDEIWGKGYVKTGDVNLKSIRYVTNYMLLKDVNVQEGQEKPFVLMSRKPGLGQKYIRDNKPFHGITGSPWLQKAGEYKVQLPRYYQEKCIPEHLKEGSKKDKQERYEQFLELKRKWSEKVNPLDPPEAIRKEKEHKELIRNLRRKKGKL